MKKMMIVVLALILMALSCVNGMAEEIVENTETAETVEEIVEIVEAAAASETEEIIETVETETVETIETETAALTFSFDTEIRVSADGMSDILMVAAAGTAYEVIEMNGCWTKVACEGIVGYIFNGEIAEKAEIPTLTVFSSRKANVSLNEEIVLSSRLDGVAEGACVTYQWQRDNGNGYEDIEGANGSTYIYSATVESLSCSYRLLVTIAD